jgi:hypothetical protein
MLAAISADGSSLKPMVIIQRTTYEVDVFESAFTPEKVVIVHRERGFIDPALFDHSAATVLFPEIERRRIEYRDDGNAVIILDGCSSHDSHWFLDESLARGTTLQILPPHSSDRTHALDLGLFGITKCALAKVRSDPEKSAQSNQLIRMLCAWHTAAALRNIIASFRRSGVVVHWDGNRAFLTAAVVLEEANRAQEVCLRERGEDEVIDQLLSDDELEDMSGRSE